jgi:hypothetical protein
LLPAVFFLLATGTNIGYFTDLTASVITLLMTLCMACTFASYQNPDAPKYLFNISLLIAAGAFLWPPVILFIPVFWIVFFQFKSLGGRSFSASLLGIFVVILFIFTYGIWNDDLESVWRYVPDFCGLLRMDFSDWNRVETVRALYGGTMVVISFIYLINRLFSEKVRTQNFLFFLYVFFLIVVLGTIFSSAGKYTLFSMIYLAYSFLISRLFTLSGKKITVYLLIFSILFYISSYFVSYYITNHG